MAISLQNLLHTFNVAAVRALDEITRTAPDFSRYARAYDQGDTPPTSTAVMAAAVSLGAGMAGTVTEQEDLECYCERDDELWRSPDLSGAANRRLAVLCRALRAIGAVIPDDALLGPENDVQAAAVRAIEALAIAKVAAR